MAGAGGTRTRRSPVKAVPEQDKPAPVSINLDTIEREDGQAQPFVVVLGGKRYLFADVLEVPLNDLLAAQTDDMEFLRIVVSSDDREDFFAAIGALPMWKVREVVAAYFKHYGMPALPEGSASLT